ncbi:MAG: hypothetical protein AAF512_19970, partial [Pseudomonadota bacterium]
MSWQLCIFLILWSLSILVMAADTKGEPPEQIQSLEKPLYTPFVENYILNELRQLRRDLAEQRVELTEKVVDRELNVSSRAIGYAADTVTYFFYLIAGVSSVLVLVGWSSFRDIRERVQSLADEEIEKVVDTYEKRLLAIEEQLKQKAELIDANREEIERSQRVQSLWLRAEQENLPENKISVYDQILELSANNCEALTYKADAVLELNEPRWAINLCRL